MKKKIYLAAPLFNEMELKRNEEIKKMLVEHGYDVYLPQEEVGLASEMITKENKLIINKKIFDSDIKGIKDSDILLFLLDGRVPDEGACVELGMAYAWNKKCVGYKTDTRALDITGDDNLFIEGCFDFRVARNINELLERLEIKCKRL